MTTPDAMSFASVCATDSGSMGVLTPSEHESKPSSEAAGLGIGSAVGIAAVKTRKRFEYL